MRTVNNNYFVRIIEIKPKNNIKSPVLDVDGKPFKDNLEFDEHPYQAEVVYAPERITINGFEYPNNIKPGDKILLSVRTMVTELFDKRIVQESYRKHEERLVTWQGEALRVIRHQEILAVV